ncbi:MAG: hypothetical protein AAFN93_25330, partial [Bacteroidota bacterium]
WTKGKQQTTWNITINEGEISNIPFEDAASGDMIIWKSALWGNWRDCKSIKYLQDIFPDTLGALIERRHWRCHKGLEIRKQESGSSIEPAPFLAGWRKVNVHRKTIFPNSSRTKFRFTIPDSALELIQEESLFVRKGRTRPFRLSTSPHVLIKAVSGQCTYSEIDFVIPDPQIGIATESYDKDLLCALSVFLNSSIVQYFWFFQSPARGIKRDRVYIDDIKKTPLPQFSSEQITVLIELHRNLSYLEEFTDKSDTSLQELLDDSIQEIFAIPYSISLIAREFLSTRVQLRKGKTVVPATEPPSDEQLTVYGASLQNELDTFTEGSGLKHSLTFLPSTKMVVCVIEFVQSNNTLEIEIERSNQKINEFLHSTVLELKQRFSQWVYIQRSLRIFSSSAVFICKPARLIDWTQTQALNDADDLIAEILSANHELHEVVH